MSYDYMNMDDDMRSPWKPPADDAPAKKWPPGYWEKHAALREEARTLCGYQNANVVVLMNGYYEVRLQSKDGREHAGPQCSDRLDALTAFIAAQNRLL
jgi:hypothetical protein